MKRFFLLFSLLIGAALSAVAQGVVAKDTLAIAVDSIVPEPDPNAGTYVFSFYGLDNTNKRQKVQIEYTGASMYGSFSNNDFLNWDGSQGSACYNFIRRTDSDLGFYPFKNELTATVADNEGATVIDVNGLINVYGSYRRVLLHAVIPAAAPDDTVRVDMGLVSVIPNSFLQYLELHAANADYSLATGIMGRETLAPGTYYMADLLRPDFVTAAGDTIRPAAAQLTVTSGESGALNLQMELLGQDNILYLLSMHTGVKEITDTISISCPSGRVIYSEIYDMFQFQGQSADYIVAVSVAPGVLTNAPVIDVPADSILLTMTSVIPLSDSLTVHIFDAHATITTDPSNPRHATMSATLLGVNGVCYEVVFPIGFSIMPEAKDTFYVDFGTNVETLSYATDGYVNLRMSGPGMGIDVLFQNYYSLAGSYAIEDFNYETDRGNYVMLVNDAAHTFQFRDIKAAEMQIDSIGDTLHIALKVLITGDSLYIATVRLTPKEVLAPQEHSYSIGSANGFTMVGNYRPASEGMSSVLRLQFQYGLNSDGELMGDYAAVWNFAIESESLTSLAGEYGYTAGTLSATAYHTIYDHGTEIQLLPVAGTLTLTPVAPVTIGTYHTWRYAVRAYFVAANGVLYELTGENTLLCINANTGAWMEMQEQPNALDAVEDAESAPRKILENGHVLIERGNRRYSLTGVQVK